MGLSIHYSGSFHPSASLPEMIDEVSDIASTFNWSYHINEKQFPAALFSSEYDGKIYGISFTPPESETVSLCFLSNGKISSSARLRFFGKQSASPDESLLYSISVKTQFAEVQSHILLIKLLKYLSDKYLSDFKLSDEGKYWETEDENLLKEKFRSYDRFLDQVCYSLENFPMKDGETFESYFSRILKHRKKN